MKKIFFEYAAFNVWAHQQLLDVIGALTDAQRREPIENSFAGLEKTILHLLDAESIWWQRLKLVEHTVRPSEQYDGDFAGLMRQLLRQSRLWQEWVEQATEASLEHEFIYRDNKKVQHKQPVAEVLLHVFNHQTYHRGQLVTMLRQLGVRTIPATDFIAFLRTKPAHRKA
jgi:uncharacterized damage-inducible protein DinB